MLRATYNLPSLELFQKPRVTLEEQLDVRNVILDHREAVGAEAKGPTRITVRIDAAVAEHFGVGHAATHQLDPAAPLAHAAALPVADHATHGNLAARLREGKETGMEARADLLAEEFLGEEIERAFEIGKSNVRVDGQPLDLVEHGRVGGVRVVAPVALAGGDDVKRRAVLLHGPHLHGRRVRAQHGLGVHIDRVKIVARRMTFGNVQGVKVVVHGLNLGSGLDREAESKEDVLDLALHPHDGMNRAERPAKAGESQVNSRKNLVYGCGQLQVLEE